MTLTMFDSVDVGVLPPGGDAYAGYADGAWPTLAAVRARFPGAHILSIAVQAAQDADALDVERLDATPAQAAGWVERQHKRGVTRPCLYANASTMPAVVEKLAAAGVARHRVRLWSAHYGAGEHICGPTACAYPGVPHCDGTQFTDKARGLNLDQSTLHGTFFHRHPVQVWQADGTTTLAQLARKHHTAESTILRLTAVHDTRFPPEVAAWLDTVFGPHPVAPGPPPKGARLVVPAD